jgi:hypothetical protein
VRLIVPRCSKRFIDAALKMLEQPQQNPVAAATLN